MSAKHGLRKVVLIPCLELVENEGVGKAVFHTPTLPETKIAPENRLLEKEIPIGSHHF